MVCQDHTSLYAADNISCPYDSHQGRMTALESSESLFTAAKGPTFSWPCRNSVGLRWVGNPSSRKGQRTGWGWKVMCAEWGATACASRARVRRQKELIVKRDLLVFNTK
jgi:hypothetical protein